MWEMKRLLTVLVAAVMLVLSIGCTSNSAGDAPAWSPDGKRIAFSSNFFGDDEIFMMDANGTNVVRLNQKGTLPDWR